jgi:hypothetical protein
MTAPVASRIDPSRRDLVEEFRRHIFGAHSPDLRLLLNQLRAGQAGAPYLLVCTKPHCEWALARKARTRGSPVELVPGVVFSSPEEAEWDVFRRLWKEATGQDLP